MIVQQHEFNLDGVCPHCGAQSGSEKTCVNREVLTKQPRVFVSAMNDIDGIHARIKELQAEQEAALKQ